MLSLSALYANLRGLEGGEVHKMVFRLEFGSGHTAKELLALDPGLERWEHVMHHGGDTHHGDDLDILYYNPGVPW